MFLLHRVIFSHLLALMVHLHSKLVEIYTHHENASLNASMIMFTERFIQISKSTLRMASPSNGMSGIPNWAKKEKYAECQHSFPCFQIVGIILTTCLMFLQPCLSDNNGLFIQPLDIELFLVQQPLNDPNVPLVGLEEIVVLVHANRTQFAKHSFWFCVVLTASSSLFLSSRSFL